MVGVSVGREVGEASGSGVTGMTVDGVPLQAKRQAAKRRSMPGRRRLLKRVTTLN